ncbi:MAG: glutathione S-transferase family protein [Paracoccaceae bacterium]
MLTLITFPANFGQLSLSPFCVKAIYFLNRSGQAWQREDCNDPRKTPHQKLPVLRTPDGLVHDSDRIRAYLETQGAVFDGGLSVQDLAIARAFQRLAEDHLYFLLVLDRWGRDEVWPTIRDTYFAEIPKLLRGPITGMLRRNLLKGLDAQGLGRLSWVERKEHAEQDLGAISAQLGTSDFLLGQTVTSADLCVAPVLAAIASSPIPTDLSCRVAQDVQLCNYIARVHSAAGC